MLIATKILKFTDRVIQIGETVPEGLLGPQAIRSHLNLGRIERIKDVEVSTHECELCDKGFKSSRALKVHLSYHKGRGNKRELVL